MLEKVRATPAWRGGKGEFSNVMFTIRGEDEAEVEDEPDWSDNGFIWARVLALMKIDEEDVALVHSYDWIDPARKYAHNHANVHLGSRSDPRRLEFIPAAAIVNVAHILQDFRKKPKRARPRFFVRQNLLNV